MGSVYVNDHHDSVTYEVMCQCTSHLNLKFVA